MPLSAPSMRVSGASGIHLAVTPKRVGRSLVPALKEAIAVAQGRLNPGRVTFWLPLPPSANSRLSYGKGRVYRSKAYREWLVEAGWELVAAKPAPICGWFDFQMAIAESARPDADNLLKCVLDLLQAHRIIENDKLAWSAGAVRDPTVPPGSCRITLTPIVAEIRP